MILKYFVINYALQHMPRFNNYTMHPFYLTVDYPRMDFEITEQDLMFELCIQDREQF